MNLQEATNKQLLESLETTIRGNNWTGQKVMEAEVIRRINLIPTSYITTLLQKSKDLMESKQGIGTTEYFSLMKHIEKAKEFINKE